MFNKVIIWGYPLNSHTHSYIHYGWVKAFKHLGYETYWFHDNEYPEDFDYNNTLFITEGYADHKIPINETSIYVVHVCINPEKYYGHVKRIIDMRYNDLFINDCNYDYKLDLDKCIKISSVSYYEKLKDTSGITRYKNDPLKINYEAFYTSWATDLLPDEIDFDWVNIPKENKIFYSASISNTNMNEINNFKTECLKNNIEFITNNPWNRSFDFETNRKLTQISYLAPDIRGSGMRDNGKDNGCNHKLIGYIPCRVFKNISYGQLGGTNSKRVYDLFEGNIIYDDDESKLFYKMKEKMNDKNYIVNQMKYVSENHTFINRINDLLKVIALE
jgi:hypothetical protein